jgi:hypothetical protein
MSKIERLMTTYQFRLSLNEVEVNWIKGLDHSVDTENSLAGILAGKMAERKGNLMATESYSLSFSDGEIGALEEALEMMIEECRLEGINPREPFLTNLKHAEALYARRHKDGIQTSVSRFPQR